jgi:hypothetical protein
MYGSEPAYRAMFVERGNVRSNGVRTVRHRFLKCWLIVAISTMESYADDSCGKVKSPNDTYEDLNRILRCLEEKIERTASPPPTPSKCRAQDNGNATLRGCVTAVNGGSSTTVQVEIQNKSANTIVIAIDKSSKECGSVLSNSAGIPYSDYSGYPPQCTTLPQLVRELNPKTFRNKVLTQGVHLSRDERTTVTYTHFGSPEKLGEIEYWSLSLSFYLAEITDEAAKADSVFPVSLSFPEIRRQK